MTSGSPSEAGQGWAGQGFAMQGRAKHGRSGNTAIKAYQGKVVQRDGQSRAGK